MGPQSHSLRSLSLGVSRLTSPCKEPIGLGGYLDRHAMPLFRRGCVTIQITAVKKRPTTKALKNRLRYYLPNSRQYILKNRIANSQGS